MERPEMNSARLGGSSREATPSVAELDDPFATNPFGTPAADSSAGYESPHRPALIRSNTTRPGPAPRRRLKSSRLMGELEKPWLENTKRKINWDSIIFYTCAGIGLGLGGFLCWRDTLKIPNNEYCLIMDDQFANLDNWNHEVQMNGFGTGSFDWTTDDEANSWIDAEGLHIVPTLTTETTNITPDQINHNYNVNMTKDAKAWGTCTATKRENVPKKKDDPKDSRYPCAAVSNTTKGQIINPVRSARLNTKGKKTIKYGRVEVEARMPLGDWLWPAIWMMPEKSVYGDWPKSGEIDIAESRGNDARVYPGGDNLVSSALHFGTSSLNDRWALSFGEWGTQRTRFSQSFHTYALEWSEKYLFCWLDGRLRHILYFDFTENKNMWTYGKFASESINGSVPVDPWGTTGRSNTPFDQDFFLILNVAVGGTNGWFSDGIGGKPWADDSETPMRDFWLANETWAPTWGTKETRGMVVKSVKMWQEGKCSG